MVIKVGPAIERVLYLSPETEASPRTGLKDVPGAISARLETAPCKETVSHSQQGKNSSRCVLLELPFLQRIGAASWVPRQ